MILRRLQKLMNLKTNIEKEHYVLGVRLTHKFKDFVLKYHTDFESDKIISIQLGIGE